jgi:hypothetical protein
VPYINYCNSRKAYFATKKRPNNQNTNGTQQKIAARLLRYIKSHQDTELTALQKNFIDHLYTMKSKYRVSHDDINIAHGVAISQIIHYFVRILNNPKQLDTHQASLFIDATLSSESSTDDKGRESINDFLTGIKNNTLSKVQVLQQVNEIIKALNKCSRNLSVGYSRVNKSIQEYEDPLLIAKKGERGKVKKLEHAERVSYFFKQLPGNSSYSSVKTSTSSGSTIVLSSSIHPQKEKSYYVETPSGDTFPIYASRR